MRDQGAIVQPATDIAKLLDESTTDADLSIVRARIVSLEARREALKYIRSVKDSHFTVVRASQSVYFIQAGESGPIKIGKTDNDVQERLRALQTGNHVELRVLAKSRLLSESRLHSIFCHLCIRGEWFRPATELLDAIEAAKSLPDDELVVAIGEFNTTAIAVGGLATELKQAVAEFIASGGTLNKIPISARAAVQDALDLIEKVGAWVESGGQLQVGDSF